MSTNLRELIDTLHANQAGLISSQSPAEFTQSLQRLERLLKHPLPQAYATWLEVFESATVHTVNLFGLTGQGHLFQQQSAYLDRGWLNIANDGCGNYYALVLSGEFALPAPVVFVDSYLDIDDAFVVASDFEALLRGLLANAAGKFHWPFDETETLKLDPALSQATGIRFPWSV